MSIALELCVVTNKIDWLYLSLALQTILSLYLIKYLWKYVKFRPIQILLQMCSGCWCLRHIIFFILLFFVCFEMYTCLEFHVSHYYVIVSLWYTISERYRFDFVAVFEITFTVLALKIQYMCIISSFINFKYAPVTIGSL